MDRAWEKVNAAKLALLLDPEKLGEARGEESAAALRQQLAAPLLPDLLVVPGVERDRISRLAATRGTFLAQLTNPEPSLEVLQAIKNFARFVQGEKSNPLRGEAAEVLYFGAIAAALVGCNQRITSLADEKLREGLHWASQRPGAEQLRDLFATALRQRP